MSQLIFSTSGQPVVVSEEGRLNRDITNYLLYLHNVMAYEKSYVRQISYRLNMWLNFIGEGNLYSVNTDDLIRFRDSMRSNVSMVGDDSAGPKKPATINHYLNAICAFYWHAEQNGWVRRMIGISDYHAGLTYRIAVMTPNKNSTSFYKIPFLLSVPHTERKYIPTTNEVIELKDAIEDRTFRSNSPMSHEINIRNMLMFRWLSEVGLRREEIASLTIDSIPSISGNNDQIFYSVEISEGTKFGKCRRVQVAGDLLKETHKFIKYEREVLINEYHNSAGGIRELFINTNSKSTKLNSDTITYLITASSDKITPHALRRFALTRFAARLYRVEAAKIGRRSERVGVDRKRIEMQVKEQAGHESIDTTIKHYIDVAITTSLPKDEILNLVHREQELTSEIAVIRSQIKASEDLDAII